MWKVEFLLRPDKCLWIRLSLTLSLVLLRGSLFLFIDGRKGMCAAWSWKILPVEPIPGKESLKSRDIPQERLSYSKHTHHTNTNKHEHKVLISSRSRARLSTQVQPPSFYIIFIFIYIDSYIGVFEELRHYHVLALTICVLLHPSHSALFSGLKFNIPGSNTILICALIKIGGMLFFKIGS